MDITYSTRSQFLDTCESVIREQRTGLDGGNTVVIALSEGGYDGRVAVTINQANRISFGTDWTSSDPSRFPARIKAAATALLNCGCEGTFEVSHTDGSLAVRAI